MSSPTDWPDLRDELLRSTSNTANFTLLYHLLRELEAPSIYLSLSIALLSERTLGIHNMPTMACPVSGPFGIYLDICNVEDKVPFLARTFSLAMMLPSRTRSRSQAPAPNLLPKGQTSSPPPLLSRQQGFRHHASSLDDPYSNCEVIYISENPLDNYDSGVNSQVSLAILSLDIAERSGNVNPGQCVLGHHCRFNSLPVEGVPEFTNRFRSDPSSITPKMQEAGTSPGFTATHVIAPGDFSSRSFNIYVSGSRQHGNAVAQIPI